MAKDTEFSEFYLHNGGKAKWKGYAYIKDAIDIVRENSDLTVVYDIYPMIGKKYSKTWFTIEHCIRYAISQIDSGAFLKIGLGEKPTNSEVIWHFALKNK